MDFPAQIPDALENEANKLLFVGGCLFMNSHRDRNLTLNGI